MDSAHHQSSIDPPDYSHSSSISEVDSLSDSDWLDLSSNRESDDNNSVSSNCDGDGLPHSRRSSMSAGSSRDGDIEAWEGFVDDSADEAVPVDQLTSDISPILPFAADGSEPTAFDHVPTADVAEDQRVNDALDQSLTSTLNASRSSSIGAPARHSTPQCSLRDLRLSFPDPLTSSRDEVNDPYEDASPSEPTFSASDLDDAPTPYEVQPSMAADTDPPEVPQSECANDHSTCHLDIILYGCSPAIKWDFIDTIVKKVAAGGQGRAIGFSRDTTDGYTRSHCIQAMTQSDGFSSLVVTVTDSTEGNTSQSTHSIAQSPVGKPSLAVVYLPSDASFPSPTDHDYYLPVFVRPPATSPFGDGDRSLQAARRIWDTLAIPSSKILRLMDANDFHIFDSEGLDNVPPSCMHQVFQSISALQTRKPEGHFAIQLTSLPSLTILALLSLVLGLVVNHSLRTSDTAPTPVVPTPNQSWNLLCPVINHSTAVPQNPVTTDVAIIPSSLKDFALAVFNPASAASDKYRNIQPTPIRASSAFRSTDRDKQMVRSEKPRSPRDIIALPGSSSLSEGCPNISPSKGKTTVPSQAESSTSSLSLRIADSLSVFFDIRTVLDVACGDLKEVIAALDELEAAISRQTAIVMKRSKGKAETVGDVLQYRNSRARGRAKELKDMAEVVITLANEQMKGRAGIARAKAKALKDYYLASMSWSPPRKRYSETTKGEKPNKEKRKRKQRKRRAGKLFSAGG